MHATDAPRCTTCDTPAATLTDREIAERWALPHVTDDTAGPIGRLITCDADARRCAAWLRTAGTPGISLREYAQGIPTDADDLGRVLALVACTHLHHLGGPDDTTRRILGVGATILARWLSTPVGRTTVDLGRQDGWPDHGHARALADVAGLGAPMGRLCVVTRAHLGCAGLSGLTADADPDALRRAWLCGAPDDEIPPLSRVTCRDTAEIRAQEILDCVLAEISEPWAAMRDLADGIHPPREVLADECRDAMHSVWHHYVDDDEPTAGYLGAMLESLWHWAR